MTVILVAVNSVLLVIQVSEKDKEGTNGFKKKKIQNHRATETN